MDESLVYEILSVVAEIPEGRVATYGQIARLIGREKNARFRITASRIWRFTARSCWRQWQRPAMTLWKDILQEKNSP